MLYGAKNWLTPLYERMHEHLLVQDILHADETTLQVPMSRVELQRLNLTYGFTAQGNTRIP